MAQAKEDSRNQKAERAAIWIKTAYKAELTAKMEKKITGQENAAVQLNKTKKRSNVDSVAAPAIGKR